MDTLIDIIRRVYYLWCPGPLCYWSRSGNLKFKARSWKLVELFYWKQAVEHLLLWREELNKMFVVLVVILSSLVFSSAQPVKWPPAEPSPECIAAYNTTFDTASPTNCSLAFTALLSGNASSQQKMMVCDANQQCNNVIENIISLCGNAVSWV